MPKKILLFALLLFCNNAAFSQVDSLEEQIRNYEPVKPELIMKGRAMLTDLFPDGERQKTIELIAYLTELEKKGFTVFSSMERIFIGYWTSNYPQILNEIYRSNPQVIYPPVSHNSRYPDYDDYAMPDDLLNVLRAATVQKFDSLLWNVKASFLPDDSKEFLALYLKYILRSHSELNISADSVDSEAKTFLENYPESVHAAFAKRFTLPASVEKKPMAIGFEFAPAGVNVRTGALSENFTNAYALALGMEFYIKRVVIYTRMVGDFAKTAVNIPVISDSLFWPRDLSANFFNFHGAAGYLVVDKNKMRLAPFAGIAYTSVSVIEDDWRKYPWLEDFKLKTYSYVFGVNYDFLVKRKSSPSGNFYYPNYYRTPSSGWFLRATYTCYYPQFEMKYNDYGGVINSITISFGGFLGN